MEEMKFSLSGLVAEKTMIKVGKLTGANVIFSGSYLVSGKNIRVIARLINVETGKAESSAKIDGTFEKIFDLQDKVILTLLSETGKVNIPDVARVKIAEEEKKNIEKKTRPKNDAYELFAKGLELQDINPKEALAYFAKALEADENYVASLTEAGLTAGYTLNLFDEALDYLTRADKILKSRKATNNADYAKLMMYIGIVYASKVDLDLALKYFMNAQEIRNKFGLQNTSDHARLVMDIGTVYWSKGELDSAMKYYLDAQAIMDSYGLKNTAVYTTLMMNIGNVYNTKRDLDSALRYYMDSQAIRDRLGLQNTSGYADLMANIGTVYRGKGDLDFAMKYYLDSQQIQDKLGLQNTVGYANILFNMGLLYEKQGNIGMAGKYYRNSHDTCVRAGYIGPLKDKAFKNAQRLGY